MIESSTLEQTLPAPSSTTNPTRRNIWNFLTDPPASVTGEKRRKAKLLLAMAAVFFPLATIAVFITPVSNIVAGKGLALPYTPLLIALGLIGAAYVLARFGQYTLGALAMIGVPFVAVIGTITVSEMGASESALLFSALTVILAGLLLSARETFIIGAVAVVLDVLAPNLSAIAGDTISWPVVSLVAISTGVLTAVSRIRDQHVKALESTQAELQEQVVVAETARARAERSEYVKSAFLASMSHELRTPLNAIINFSRFVAKGTLGPVNEEQEETLGEVIDSARHLLNLINDVLDMSKIESGSLNLFISDDVNLKDIIDQTVSTGKGLLGGKLVDLQTDIADDLPLIRVDRQRIVQVMLNIISNACKFTEQGVIKVSAYRENDSIILSVSDTGAGIALKDQASVFEAFKQTESGLRQGGGTGLGMPISKSLVEAHDGTLRLESEPGKGTTFYVSLPIQATKSTTAIAV